LRYDPHCPDECVQQPFEQDTKAIARSAKINLLLIGLIEKLYCGLKGKAGGTSFISTRAAYFGQLNPDSLLKTSRLMYATLFSCLLSERIAFQSRGRD
jgi:hypothetical protein